MAETTLATRPAPSLSAEELEAFHRDGFVGPFTLSEPDEIAILRVRIAAILKPEAVAEDVPSMIARLDNDMRMGFGRHHEFRFLFDLANSPAIKGRVASILGEDILLWRTMFFNKPPGASAVPWHQDFDDWELEPMVVTSCWLAIDDAGIENGCVELIPGSHRKIYRMVASEGDVMDGFERMSDPSEFDDAQIHTMELKRGQFFLFNERVLHRSKANSSTSQRLGMAMRYLPTMVRMLDPEDRAILVGGQDRFGMNRLVSPVEPAEPDAQ
jgi:ectoine hydroxylase-related dioxygenase (phytanoyl-CoA dioxygenase family)